MFFLLALTGPITILIALWVGAAFGGIIFRRIWVALVTGILSAAGTYLWWTADLFRMDHKIKELCRTDVPVIYEKRTGVDAVSLDAFRTTEVDFLSAATNFYTSVANPIGPWGPDRQRYVLWKRAEPGEQASHTELSGISFSEREIRLDERPKYELREESPATEKWYGEFRVFRNTLKIIDAKSNKVLGVTSMFTGESLKSPEFELKRVLLFPKVAQCQFKERLPFIAQVLEPKGMAQ